MKVVFDTNIYLAALQAEGLSFKVLETVLMPKRGFVLFISNAIKKELDEKLLVWLDKGWVEEMHVQRLQFVIDRFVQTVEPKKRIKMIKADPDDNKILECAVTAQANLIVSMDKHLLRLKQFRGIAIVHPKTFSFMLPLK